MNRFMIAVLQKIFLFFVILWTSQIVSADMQKPLLVTNYPVYLIAKDITRGVEVPQILLEKQSGHDIHLTPAHRKKIQDASLIIWIGKEHEAPLQKVLQGQKNAVSILDAGIINRLPMRDNKGVALSKTVDTHVWLDPNHAVRIGFFIAILRGQQFPEHKEKYRENAQKFASKMFQAAQHYKRQGSGQVYWAYHDAYQYMEQALNLKFAGAMIGDAHTPVTAAQLKYMSERRPQRKMCLLAESHVNKNQYRYLEPVVFQSVDETFQKEQNFVDAWKKLAQSIQRCLHQAKS